MADGDVIMMRVKELERVGIIERVLSGELTQKSGAELAALSERQIQRIVKRIRKEGMKGICHKGRGKRSNRKLAKEVRQKVMDLYREKYSGFGPMFAAEKLLETNGIKISHETLRLWLIDEGLDYPKRKRRPGRKMRERKEHYGEMVQIDGCHHDWFEGRGNVCVLMGYIDDATGHVFGRFYEYEGTYPALDSFNRYALKYGLPLSVYTDKHTTYKSPAKPAVEDELKGEEGKSQFERALGELGVKVLHANSPQAKGRIERIFRTFQDRLVKEMRLGGISNIADGNDFLKRYLEGHNKKYCVEAVSNVDFHRPADKDALFRALCIKEERTVRNDGIISYKGKLYQLDCNVKRVMVEERLDGRLYISHKGLELNYKEIEKRPLKKEVNGVEILPKRRKAPSDHPWRNRYARKIEDGDIPFSST